MRIQRGILVTDDQGKTTFVPEEAYAVIVGDRLMDAGQRILARGGDLMVDAVREIVREECGL